MPPLSPMLKSFFLQTPKRRRKEAPLTDRGDPPVALGPNARLLAAYSTPGALLHAAGIDPGFVCLQLQTWSGHSPGPLLSYPGRARRQKAPKSDESGMPRADATGTTL